MLYPVNYDNIYFTYLAFHLKCKINLFLNLNFIKEEYTNGRINSYNKGTI